MQESMRDAIIKTVQTYKGLFPDEYKAAKQQVAYNRQQTTATGDMSKNIDFIERPILEYPETLYSMLMQVLTPYTTKDIKPLESKEVARFIAKTFPEFSLIERI